MWRIIAPLAIAGVLAVVAAGVVLALNYDGEDFCQDAPGWPNGSYLGQMHPYHSEFYRGYAERRGWDPCTTWAADQQRSAVRGLAELGYTVIKPGQTVAVTVPAPTPTASGAVPQENYPGENYCRDAPGWPNGTYLGQMHPYHSEFYRGYAERRGWDPCTTWATDQRNSAIRGLRELGYTVLEPGQQAPTPAFTLSGTVRDSRENGPVLAGAVVWLENGKRRESMLVGHDGRYSFPGVWGPVTVTAIAAPTHVTETVEISVDEDQTLDFDLEHTGVPPYGGTVHISPRIIEPSDPTMLASITYAGRGKRSVPDRRHDGRPTINAYLFHVRYGEHVVEFRVNPEFGSQEAAQAQVETYGHVLGQLPAVLVFAITHIVINAGDEPWGGGGKSHGGVLVHTEGSGVEFIEEVMLHEAGHAAWDRSLRDSPGWLEAQAADGVFISTYARDNPHREDLTESFTAYFALRYQPERLTFGQRAKILSTIPNRLIYFDQQGFDMSPYEPSETQEPPEEIFTIHGKVVGPNNQPLEGVLLWAWSGRIDDSGYANTREDGSFAIAVPDGSFTLDVHSIGRECTHVGWYGPGGFTAVWNDATRFEIAGESVVGIVIRLPDNPSALPCV